MHLGRRAIVTESRAILLGLAAIALIPFALAASLVYKSVVLRERPQLSAPGPIDRAFLAAASGRSQTVSGLDHLLPRGIPEKTALERVAVDGFACTFETNAATCFRSVGAGSATDIWTIWLTFDNAANLTSSQGERRTARL